MCDPAWAGQELVCTNLQACNFLQRPLILAVDVTCLYSVKSSHVVICSSAICAGAV